MSKKIKINLAEFSSAKIGHEINLSPISSQSARVRGVIWSQICPESFEAQKSNLPYLIGSANNALVSPEITELAALSEDADYIKNLGGGRLEIGAKTSAKNLYLYAKKNDLKGLEFLAHIPGQIGALIRGNAGLPGAEICSKISQIYSFEREIDASFCYRNSSICEVITCAIFCLESGFDHALDARLKLLRKNQPSGASFGSTFKNHAGASAGALIDKCGLKGERIGGVIISPKHANFFINQGGAKFDDYLALIVLARRRVFEEFGIMLEPEVQVFI